MLPLGVGQGLRIPINQLPKQSPVLSDEAEAYFLSKTYIESPLTN